MLIETKNNKQVLIRKFNLNDIDLLYNYLQKLSDETKKRYGPHSFDKETIYNFYNNSNIYIAYLGIELETNDIIAYSIIKIGYLEEDSLRYKSYGIVLDKINDCEFAPSVADAWQSCGIGDKIFKYIISDIKSREIKRIVLWGGVQKDNERAVNYYKKNGFEMLGQFTHNGENYDMIYYFK